MKEHPVWVLLLASLLTALVVYSYARKPRQYIASVVLRVTQGELNDERGAPLPNIELESYVYDYVLNRGVLIENIIKNEDLKKKDKGFFRTYEKFGPDAAIEELREGLDITAFRNYFIYDSRYESVPRSLRLEISYTYTDPDVGYFIASKLATIVVDNEQAQRLREAKFAVTNAREVVNDAAATLATLQKQMNEARFKLEQAEISGDQTKRAAAYSETNALRDKIKQADSRLSTLRREQQAIEFRKQLEEREMGLLWEVARDFRPQRLPPPGPIRLALLAIVCFCVFVPVCAIAFGTLDSRIYELEDVSRLGLPTIGHIPAFSGDHVGSLKSRGALVNRGLLSRLFRRQDRRVQTNRVT